MSHHQAHHAVRRAAHPRSAGQGCSFAVQRDPILHRADLRAAPIRSVGGGSPRIGDERGGGVARQAQATDRDDEDDKKRAREAYAEGYLQQWAVHASDQIQGPFLGGARLSVADLKLYVALRSYTTGVYDHVRWLGLRPLRPATNPRGPGGPARRWRAPGRRARSGGPPIARADALPRPVVQDQPRRGTTPPRRASVVTEPPQPGKLRALGHVGRLGNRKPRGVAEFPRDRRAHPHPQTDSPSSGRSSRRRRSSPRLVLLPDTAKHDVGRAPYAGPREAAPIQTRATPGPLACRTRPTTSSSPRVVHGRRPSTRDGHAETMIHNASR